MKKFRAIYIISLIVFAAIIGVFMYHQWWFLSGVSTILLVGNIVNLYDIYLLNREDEEKDPSEIRRRAKHFMKLKEEEKLQFYQKHKNYEELDKRFEREYKNFKI